MKRIIMLMIMTVCLAKVSAQSLVVELNYNANGRQYAALCVFNGNAGRCHVFTDIGNCWYNAYYASNGSYSTISLTSPSTYGWIPGVCYFTQRGNYVVFQGYQFPLYSSVIPNYGWQAKKAQYGFRNGSVSFRGNRKCRYPIGSTRCSDINKCPGFDEGPSMTICKHCGHDTDWHK